MKRMLLSVALLAIPLTYATASESTKDPKKINAVLERIPVTDKALGYRNLGERLPKVGMAVEFVKVVKIGKGDSEPPDILAGDEVVDLFLTEPNEVVRAICPISGGIAAYVIRGKKVIPQTRTAYWLMTNRCDYKG